MVQWHLTHATYVFMYLHVHTRTDGCMRGLYTSHPGRSVCGKQGCAVACLPVSSREAFYPRFLDVEIFVRL